MPTVLDLFSPAARAWFSGAFPAPTEVQDGGWRSVAAGQHTLMSAATGSGKTLAAFFWCIDRLATEPVPAEAERCRVLYVSPLKALTVDIERNLQAPLRGIGLQAERMGIALPPTPTRAPMGGGQIPRRDRAGASGRPATPGSWNWYASTAPRSSSSTRGGSRSGWPPPSTNWPARTWFGRITGRSPRNSAF